MGHRFVEHVGEVELALNADTEAGVFGEALTAFRELVDESAPHDREVVSREIGLGPADEALLLVDWLNELVFLAEVDGLVPLRIEHIDLGAGRLHATVGCVRGRPRHLVKGATLHGLELSEDEQGGWHARIVLDV